MRSLEMRVCARALERYPSFTARLPPGRKQFCTSTTISALDALGAAFSPYDSARRRVPAIFGQMWPSTY